MRTSSPSSDKLISSSSSSLYKNKWGLLFKYGSELLLLGIVCFVGGCLNRIRGGWLGGAYPLVDTGSDGTAFDVYWHDTTLRWTFAIPTGLLVSCLLQEGRERDPYHLKSALTGIAVALMARWSLPVGWGVYMGTGHGATGYKSRIGFADWLIGHDCEGWDFPRRFCVEFVGMSLRGLLQTAPPGLLLWILGYGYEYMVMGMSMGLYYYIAWEMPEGFQPIEMPTCLLCDHAGWAEVRWGMWTWFVLSCMILSRRNNPHASLYNNVFDKNHPRSEWTLRLRTRKFFFYFFLAFINFIFIGSCIGYSFVNQSDKTNSRQTLSSLIVTTVIFVIIQISLLIARCYLTVDSNTKDLEIDEAGEEKTSHSLNQPNADHYYALDDRITDMATELSKEESDWKDKVWKVLVANCPKGNSPYCYFLIYIRLVAVGIWFIVVPLLVYDAIFNRIMKPCDIPWG